MHRGPVILEVFDQLHLRRQAEAVEQRQRRRPAAAARTRRERCGSRSAGRRRGRGRASVAELGRQRLGARRREAAHDECRDALRVARVRRRIRRQASRARRWRISPAAARVNVMARISCGGGAVEQRAQHARDQHPGLARAGARLDDAAARRIAGRRRRTRRAPTSAPSTRKAGALVRAQRRRRPQAPPRPRATSGRAGTGPAHRSSSHAAPSPSGGSAGAIGAGAAGRRRGRSTSACARRRDVDVLVHLEPAGRVHREIEGAQRQPALGADERGVEGELGVLESVDAPGSLSLLGAAGLVVDELEPAAAVATMSMRSTRPWSSTPPSASGAARSSTSPRDQAAPARFAFAQPGDVARHQDLERGAERQEAPLRRGLATRGSPHRSPGAARVSAATSAPRLAVAMKCVQYVVQPLAVIALLDLGDRARRAARQMPSTLCAKKR